MITRAEIEEIIEFLDEDGRNMAENVAILDDDGNPLPETSQPDPDFFKGLRHMELAEKLRVMLQAAEGSTHVKFEDKDA